MQHAVLCTLLPGCLQCTVVGSSWVAQVSIQAPAPSPIGRDPQPLAASNPYTPYLRQSWSPPWYPLQDKDLMAAGLEQAAWSCWPQAVGVPQGQRAGESQALHIWVAARLCLLHLLSRDNRGGLRESPEAGMQLWRPRAMLFCRAEVKSQGRCDQAGTSRC